MASSGSKEELTEECQSCRRNHSEDQPCPERLALVFTSATFGTVSGATEKLTNADRKWMREHSHFNVYAAVKSAILATLR